MSDRLPVAGAVVRGVVLLLVTAFAVPAEAVERPSVLWNREDVAAIKQKIRTQDWAKEALENLRAGDPRSKPLRNLFLWAALADREAGEAEKKELMRMVRSPVPQGSAQWINVVRYDQLHDLLSPEERAQVEACFRTYIDLAIHKRDILDPKIFNDSRNYSRYDARKYTRSNWLPNIIWPRKTSANLMAAALADKPLIRNAWAAYGSWKWYFDEYLGDVGFYEEEFSKMGSTPGAMLVYCRALERLGLGQLGYGYTGKGGATMKGHIESLIHLGYPRIDLGSDRPMYPMVTIGDLRASPAFQHSIVAGYRSDGSGGDEFWKAPGAWGGAIRGEHAQWDGYSNFTPKMQIPLWFEIAQKQWPDLGFDYFLAQMRRPDERKYIPSLFFGLDPIDPRDVKPPPAPSAVWPDRGLVMLRADESPAYWQSEAPAVCMRLASNYAHHVNDSFVLAGFYAFNRPIYLNRHAWPGYAQGWTRSVESHCGVKVDGQEPRFTSATTVRRAFDGLVKFVAARSAGVYPGVDLTRSLLLTREYLLDVTRLASGAEHDYYWFVHALGRARPAPGWQGGTFPEGLTQLADARVNATGDEDWSVTVLQTCAFDDPSKARLPRAWYERKIGVRMRMLGRRGTRAYIGRTPFPIRTFRDDEGNRRQEEVPPEVGGETILAARKAKETSFVALHEPFKDGRARIADFRRIAETDRGVAVAVLGKVGSAVNDRLLLRLGDGWNKPLTLSGGGEQFTFADWAYIRIGKDTVNVSGDLRGMKVRASGSPRLIVNGKVAPADLEGGYLIYAAGR